MKKALIIAIMGSVTLGTSCKKYFDINENPNKATTATPVLILPNALTTTASVLNGFNSYGSQLVGYSANAGGYGGFGTAITYNFSTNDNSARWSGTYDMLEDYQAILAPTDTIPGMKYYNAVARIMKVHGFQLLVDAYNDVPYEEALKGLGKLSPAYTDAKVIYKDLADQLDKAIADINAAPTTPGIRELSATADVMFHADMKRWKQFANTLKLRILIRARGKVTFSNSTFDNAGFLTADATINPGYRRDNNRQNPKWNTWGFSYTGSDGSKSWMPNTFIYSMYNGTRLSDSKRGAAIYYQFPSAAHNRLGYENTSVIASPGGSFWYPSTNRTGTSAGNATGVLKGPEASMPIITAAESYFLQAEAVVRNIITGDAKALFNKGIEASYTYLYQLPDGTLAAGKTPVADATAYVTDNIASPLVNFDLATDEAKKIEAIITQKYIALNFVNGEEAWNEYRRTGYPTLLNTAGATGSQTFASTASESTRPDRLPTRILYPTSEGSYNTTNVPKNISPFTSLIFWAK
ncbi:SusD/RagB family nutrient-binding outer membrane lipoprotein [Paraflavitalea sp. CAU 1676]|uniref:SusD/RagB family nutrient-binding outer membrane lipoprotein n=1 Tax=Paraflavitalea sp. CAU 1676 TaxID=3032598 RepID=UPI0023DCB7C0|nr:SusD/RagB family nutrient-binding outer membrane lipoprotein [Paraflavitalea sp. CAU 1676]MDF2192248.1 SusD/RagB family nutrient-binding outer membrane lipoprotein [Paraflavitalea sp. CAU 1676]